MTKIFELKENLRHLEDCKRMSTLRGEDILESELVDLGYVQGQIKAYKDFKDMLNSLPSNTLPEFIKKKILKEFL